MLEVSEEDFLMHYGILRRSGRYPWGSGGNIPARSKGFLDYLKEMRATGMNDSRIAELLGMNRNDLWALNTLALQEKKASDISLAVRLKEKGMSNKAIAERMGLSGESMVRTLLKASEQDRSDNLRTIADMLKDEVDRKQIVDVGLGVNNYVGVSPEKMAAAIIILKGEGYTTQRVKVDQVGTGNQTEYKVLVPPGWDQKKAWTNRLDIQQIDSIQQYSVDSGRSFLGMVDPLPVSSKRVNVVYGGEGGELMDGTIYVRPGVKDVSIGENRYAQVRVKVDDTHYIKGMAVYSNDIPDGYDLQFHTPKARSGNKLAALKELKDDPDNPFGSTVRQLVETGPDGKERTYSAMNIVGIKPGAGAEGSWDNWSRNLPSQFLSKQPLSLAQTQLNKKYDQMEKDFDEISKLTNPSVKRKLLESFSDDADSSAVHLKAASMKGQSTHVILPVRAVKDTEVYAPNFDNGTSVALVRFPHGGKFEIPILTVNNNNPVAKKLLGDAKDAVGINSKVAERLSGADFDGDTVLVIPNNNKRVKSQPALKALEGYDAKKTYPPYDGMRTVDGGTYDAKTGKVDYGGKRPSKRTMQTEMGKVSNLINDMTIRGASDDEIARAVKHSQTVIDSEKHHLNIRESAKANGISDLAAKYQSPYRETGKPGASTLLSRAGGKKEEPEFAPRSVKRGGPIDKKTGEKVYEPTGRNRIVKPKALERVKDAHELSSGTAMEKVYADHSNRLKGLANKARLEMINTKNNPTNPDAKKAYAPEVEALVSKINLARRNAPLERQAQVLANSIYQAKVQANPGMDSDDKKRIKYQALTEARHRSGADKADVKITDREWSAIQAGAISPSRLDYILRHTDLEDVRKRATPKPVKLMSGAKLARAKTMLSGNATQAEVARALGVSLTTLKDSLNS